MRILLVLVICNASSDSREPPGYYESIDRVLDLASQSCLLIKEELEADATLIHLNDAVRAAMEMFDEATGPRKNRARALLSSARDSASIGAARLQAARIRLEENPHLLPESILTELLHLHDTRPDVRAEDDEDYTEFRDSEIEAAQRVLVAALETARGALATWEVAARNTESQPESLKSAKTQVKRALVLLVEVETERRRLVQLSRDKSTSLDSWEIVTPFL